MTIKRSQLVQALNQFYMQPVARVSMELFLSIGAVLFFALFAIRPTLITMSDLIKEIDDKKQVDQALTQKIAALSTAQSEFLGLQEQIGVLDDALPSKPDVLLTLKLVEKVASERGLVIESLSMAEIPDEPTETPLFSETKRQALTLAITLSGTYPNIRQFIEDIRNVRRSFIVDTVVFSTGEEQGTKRLRATITLQVPYFGTAP